MFKNISSYFTLLKEEILNSRIVNFFSYIYSVVIFYVYSVVIFYIRYVVIPRILFLNFCFSFYLFIVISFTLNLYFKLKRKYIIYWLFKNKLYKTINKIDNKVNKALKSLFCSEWKNKYKVNYYSYFLPTVIHIYLAIGQLILRALSFVCYIISRILSFIRGIILRILSFIRNISFTQKSQNYIILLKLKIKQIDRIIDSKINNLINFLIRYIFIIFVGLPIKYSYSTFRFFRRMKRNYTPFYLIRIRQPVRDFVIHELQHIYFWVIPEWTENFIRLYQFFFHKIPKFLYKKIRKFIFKPFLNFLKKIKNGFFNFFKKFPFKDKNPFKQIRKMLKYDLWSPYFPIVKYIKTLRLYFIVGIRRMKRYFIAFIKTNYIQHFLNYQNLKQRIITIL